MTSPYSDKSWDVALPKTAVAVSGEGKGHQWVVVESIAPAVQAAEALLKWFLEDVAGEAIQFPVTVNVRPMGARAFKGGGKRLGHFTVEPNWSTREGNPVWEVGLVAEHLNLPPRQIVATILHEAVHIYNYSRGEKDVAKSGRHNAIFGDAATEFGLVVEKSKAGFDTPDITQALWDKVQKHCPVDVTTFGLFATLAEKKEAKPSKTKAWKCHCNFKVRVPAGKELNATCETCEAKFEQDEGTSPA